jgi:hypothetical protein
MNRQKRRNEDHIPQDNTRQFLRVSKNCTRYRECTAYNHILLLGELFLGGGGLREQHGVSEGHFLLSLQVGGSAETNCIMLLLKIKERRTTADIHQDIAVSNI